MAKAPPALSRRRRRKKRMTHPQKKILEEVKERISFGSVTAKSVIEFTRNLAVMLKARLSLTRALDTAIKQTSDHKLKPVLEKVRKDVKSGHSLAGSLARHPAAFDSFYTHLVEVGELAGVLDDILLRLADYMSKRHSLRQKIKMAMVYPGMVLCVAAGAILFLLLVIVPTFAEMYRDFNAELPEITRLVMAASSWVNESFFTILFMAVALFWGVRYALKKEKVRYLMDSVKIRIPLFGSLILQTVVVRFCQTLGTLLKSGITLVDGLSILASASDNLLIREATGEMLRSVKRGGSLGSAIQKSRVFPPIVLQMITVGEETAGLDDMLLHVSSHFRREIDLKVDTLTSIIEPLLIIVLGFILGFLIVAMYLPMFELMNVIQ